MLNGHDCSENKGEPAEATGYVTNPFVAIAVAAAWQKGRLRVRTCWCSLMVWLSFRFGYNPHIFGSTEGT